MVPNVERLIIVASILVVNELYISCKEKKYFLDRDTGSRAKMMLLTALSDYLESQGFSFHAKTFLFFFPSPWLPGSLARGWGEK